MAMPTISLEDLDRDAFLQRRARPGPVVVNVLPPEAYAAGHIPGSINLPLAEIPKRAGDVLLDRDQEIILYCGGAT